MIGANRYTIYQGDTLSIEFTIMDQQTNLSRDLTGATVECRAVKGTLERDALCQTTSPADGEFEAAWAANALEPGTWLVQTRVQIGDKIQTVAMTHVEVLPSSYS